MRLSSCAFPQALTIQILICDERFDVSMPVPSNDRYWSIHAHNRNTDAFYKITNTQIDGDIFQFIISKDKTLKHNLPIAYASSNKGIILVRLTMKHFNEYDELDKFRRSTTRRYL